MEAIERGVQVFARAWDENGQIGFGKDGTVDIEKFIIINPPVLVADENRNIERTATDSLTGQTWTFTYREDPQEALLQSLKHTIDVKQQKFESANIVSGSIGNTTTTIYPDPHPESTSVDGYAAFDASGSSWATIHDAATSDSAADTPTISNGAYTGKVGAGRWIYRAFFLFDTSSIGGGATINSATFSLYPTAVVTSSIGNEYISLASSSPASNTAITTADYDQVGTTKLAPDLNTSSVTLNTYNNWVLNATGTSTINGAGVSKFVLRHGNDIVNADPSGSGYNGINGITWADEAGTTQDPKLVVEHYGSPTEAVSGDYGALVENGDFRKYEYVDGEWWRVTDKFGTIYTFGEATTTRQNKNEQATTTYKWMLEEVRDLNDNYISYEYYKDNGQIYPYKIRYTGAGSSDGIFEVEFSRTYDPDIATSTATGFPVKTYYKISEISVKASGQLTRHYALSYTDGFKNINRLLSSITESGRDELGATTTLPAYTFTYNDGFDMVWSLDTQFATSSMDDFVATGYCAGDSVWKDLGTRAADINGDGYADQVRSAPGATWTNLNSTNRGWNGQVSGWTPPPPFVYSDWSDAGTRIIDVNGDGFPDLVRSGMESGWGHASSTALHRGTGQVGWDGDLGIPIVPLFTANVGFGDVDGDSLTDLIQGSGGTHKVYINNGDDTGWAEDTSYSVPIELTDTGRWVIDVNKDGLDDLVISAATSSSQNKVYINKGDGSGWEHDPRYSIPVDFVVNGEDKGVRMADVTSDGYPDIVVSRPSFQKVYVNNGDGTGWSDYGSVTIPVDFVDSNGRETGTRLADMTGDGIPDVMQALCNGNATFVRGIYINDGDFSDTINYPDTLTSVTSAAGEEAEIKYLTTPLYKDGNNALYNPNLPLVLNTVRHIVRDDGFGNLSTTTYSYSNGEYYFADPRNKKFAGFATTTKTDPAGTVTKTYYHQGNDSLYGIGEHYDDVEKIGKPYRTEVRDGNGNVYTKTINKWESVESG